MIYYNAEMDIRTLSGKAQAGYGLDDIRVWKRYRQVLFDGCAVDYWIGYDKSNLTGPYTLTDLEKIYSDAWDEYEALGYEDDEYLEDEDDILDGDLEDILEELL